MGHGNHRTLVLLEMSLKPLDTFCVEVVGRLVKQKNIRLTQEQTAKSHTTALSTTQGRDLCIRRRALESIHSPFKLRIYLPASAVLYLFRELALTLDQSRHFVI